MASDLLVTVSLLSGKRTSLSVSGEEPVSALERRAFSELGVRSGRLILSTGDILAEAGSIAQSMNSGDLLTLHVTQSRIQNTERVFAAILGDSSVACYGHRLYGGDARVQDQLVNIHHLQATDRAFAAIRGDGTVVTWGDPNHWGGHGYGSDSSAVRDQLKNAHASQLLLGLLLPLELMVLWSPGAHHRTVGTAVPCRPSFRMCRRSKLLSQVSQQSFWRRLGSRLGLCQARRRRLRCAGSAQERAGHPEHSRIDGSVVTWGPSDTGGDSSDVQHQLKNVQCIQASSGAFAAILADRSVVCWGNVSDGADSSRVQQQLKNVQAIQASNSAFAAILFDGSVLTWGHPKWGGLLCHDELHDCRSILSTTFGFIALCTDGSAVPWGYRFNEHLQVKANRKIMHI